MHNLVTHCARIHQDDLFQYAVTAALLTTYLERRTHFFQSANEDLSLDGLRIGTGSDNILAGSFLILFAFCKRTSKTEVLQMPSAIEVNLSQKFSLLNVKLYFFF